MARKISLEKIADLNPNYGLIMVVDSSYSCFSDLTVAHSIQALFKLLQILSQIEIPYFDLIVTTAGVPTCD
jgi:hypothetical protein